MLNISSFKKLSIGGITLTRLTLDGTLIWQHSITNQVPLSINADGTPYNNGLGYRDNTRIRSGGTETAASNTSCTGYIAVNPGDVIRISGWKYSSASAHNAINTADAAFTNIGQFTTQPSHYGIFGDAYQSYSLSSVIEEKTGIWKWIVPPSASGVRYIRITGCDYAFGPPGANMIITINEEIS